MASVEIENFLVKALIGWLVRDRPVGLPAVVVSVDGEEFPLSLIEECDVEPKKRPYLVFLTDGGGKPHPSLFVCELRVEGSYQVDDFRESDLRGWLAAVSGRMDSAAARNELNAELGALGAKFFVRKVVVGAGGNEVDGERSRGALERWVVSCQVCA